MNVSGKRRDNHGNSDPNAITAFPAGEEWFTQLRIEMRAEKLKKRGDDKYKREVLPRWERGSGDSSSSVTLTG